MQQLFFTLYVNARRHGEAMTDSRLQNAYNPIVKSSFFHRQMDY